LTTGGQGKPCPFLYVRYLFSFLILPLFLSAQIAIFTIESKRIDAIPPCGPVKRIAVRYDIVKDVGVFMGL
jgi:hypothetical protein